MNSFYYPAFIAFVFIFIGCRVLILIKKQVEFFAAFLAY